MIGETCKLTLLLGGVYLLVRRVIDWRIPVAFIGTVAIAYFIKTGTLYSVESGTQNVLYQLLSGGLLLGAFFMATDYVTSPITGLGKLIMGVGCGLFLFVIREYLQLSGRLLVRHPVHERAHAADRPPDRCANRSDLRKPKNRKLLQRRRKHEEEKERTHRFHERHP